MAVQRVASNVASLHTLGMSMLPIACTLCANNQLHQRWWELGAVAAASLVLLLELVVPNPALKALSPPRRFALNGLVGVAVAAGLWGSLTAPVLGGPGFLSVLGLRALLVGAFTVRGHARTVAQRLTVTALALTICVLIKVPANRAPDELVGLLTGTPFRFEEQSWALTQLKAEGADGLAEAEKRLDALSAEDLRGSAIVTLELHQQLGGSPDRRSASCDRLVTREHDEQLALRLERVCRVVK